MAWRTDPRPARLIVSVTLEEALKELGLERIDRAEEVRAAYLRLLKQRKPEQNPEGFKRLREAYEFAVGWFERPETWTLLERELGQPRPSAEPGPRSAGPETALDFASILERFWVRLSAYETATLSRAQSPVQVLYLVHRLIDQAKAEIALAILDTLLDQLSPAEAERLPVLLFARHLLRLHGAGLGEGAASLTRKLEAWLLRGGHESDLVSGEAAATWQVCKELARLPLSLRPEVRKALVLLLLEDDHAFAERVLERFARQHPEEAFELEASLREHAPNLSKFVELPRRPGAEHTREAPPAERRLHRLLLGAALLLVVLLVWRRLGH